MMKHIVYLGLVLALAPEQTSAKTVLIDPLQRNGMQPTTACTIAESTNIYLVLNSFEDAITTLRLAPELYACGKELCVQAPRYVHQLLQMSPYTTLADAHDTRTATCSLDELILWTATQNAHNKNIPHTYLVVDQPLNEMWHDLFALHEQLKVGLYFTQPDAPSVLHASCISSTDFMPLGMLRHVRLFSFDTLHEAALQHQATMHYFKSSLHTQPHHMTAIINELDLLITTNPNIAALAWMLTKPVLLIQTDATLSNLYTSYYPDIEIIRYDSTNTGSFFNHLMERLAAWPELDNHEIITTEVQIGELIDKMTILEIKMERICDEQKLVNIGRELSSVRATFDAYIPQSAELNQLIHELKTANEALWETEDLIRDKEREKAFDDDFIRLARSVYIQNDERCRAKRAINEFLGSRLVEEKSYKPYN